MNKKYRNVLFLKDFDNKNEIQNKKYLKKYARKMKRIHLYTMDYLFLYYGRTFFSLSFFCDISPW